MGFKKEREERGFMYQFTNKKLFDLYEQGGHKFYLGIDPSSDSLQMGNLCAIMAAVHLMKRGNTCYFLVGGATGMIGDPSDKAAERNFLDENQLRHNEKKIYKQIVGFLDHLKSHYDLELKYHMINNYDFYTGMGYLDFLRDVGKYITVNNMISKESIKMRLEDPDKSISYAEFSYMLIQGYDFMYLFENNQINLQLGGSDQWGNVVTGIELVRKKHNKEVYGLTIPLITDSGGKKFGKSEGNPIWLCSNKNTPYSVYQYFLNTSDEDIAKYMKTLTLLPIPEIDDIVTHHQQDLSARYGQKALSDYIIELVFGLEALRQVQKITAILFGQEDKMKIIQNISDSDKQALFVEAGGVKVSISSEQRLLDLCVEAGLVNSNSEVKKLIKSGAIYCNEDKVNDINFVLQKDHLVNGIVLLRKGKKQYKILLDI